MPSDPPRTIWQNNPVECPDCNGNGRFSCSCCQGRAYRSCSACEGTGYPLCPYCHGSGQRTLSGVTIGRYDKRTGYALQFHSEQCLPCSGTGHLDTWCGECDGSGNVVCDECTNGVVNCGLCHGNGHIPEGTYWVRMGVDLTLIEDLSDSEREIFKKDYTALWFKFFARTRRIKEIVSKIKGMRDTAPPPHTSRGTP